MNTIEQNICDAIDIIVSKAISEAGYDKTIQATIVSCVDETIGKYKVRYQDSTFVAYSENTDVTYSVNTTVYVLVPEGDWSNDKTIIGTTTKLGINYVPTLEDDEYYSITGTNIITSDSTFGLCSYREGTYTQILYHKDYSASQNLITIDSTALQEYLMSSQVMICGATFRTELPVEQQYKGDYGIIFALDFLDNTDNNIVTRYYTIHVDNMTGNPYKLLSSTREYGIYDIDGANFQQIQYIAIYTEDFPNNRTTDLIDDIFVSDIELYAAEALSDEDISNYSLTFYTPRGTYFDASNLASDTLTLQAQVRVKGKVIDNDSQSLPFYWFVEHAGITSQSEYYNKYGGQGWKCLNNYNVLVEATDTEPAVVEWIPSSYIWTVTKSDVVAKETKYKCAVIYDGTVISRTITVKNLDSKYEITIESDLGTQFYFDNGYPTLKCLVNGVEQPTYTYSWGVTDNTGNFSSFATTADLNENYLNAYNNYINLYNDIQNEIKPLSSNAELLEIYKQALEAYDIITRVDGNTIYHLNVNTITIFSTYLCTVYADGIYLGTASLVLLNTLSTEGLYSLIIHNGAYAYKYDENGVSPACESLEDPIEIQSLTFTIYDNLGNAIDDDIAKHADITWIVPTDDTLLEIPSSYSAAAVDDENQTASYTSLMSFSYNIADKYDYTKTRNNITLSVVYKGLSLNAITDLVFIKEGESGTNGTEYLCRIVPNVPSGTTTPVYPIITTSASGINSWNYNAAATNRYFKVQLWHNENKVFENTTTGTSTEGEEAEVTWSILKNKYTSSVSDTTGLDINANTGVISYDGFQTNYPAHIIKATVNYAGVTYYATLPVITVKCYNDNYNAILKDNTGFQYVTYTSDGQIPKYDNTNPFEIVVTQKLSDGNWEDVSIKTSSTYAVTYTWSYQGRIYENNAWVTNINLEDKYITSLTEVAVNQKYIKPLDEFDGQCVTNAVVCSIQKSGTEVARIHIPIHMLLNRYGNSAINGWDGNSVQVENDGGFILAPQVGAGQKESDNSFTGVLIGKVKETNQSDADIGLLGYGQGVRTIFLDAETGMSRFGATGKGQIVIDPTSNTAQIYSGNYETSGGSSGMIIDLTTPYIKWGNGNFSVDEDGNITAVGGGTIAGWYIDSDSLWTINSSKTNTSTFRLSSVDFSRSINGSSRSSLRMAINTVFGIDSSGYAYMGSATIGTGSNKIFLGQSSGSSTYSALYSGSKSAFDAAASGFYIGTDGIALGTYSSSNGNSPFQVSNSGQLIARSGYIGNGSKGWTIQNTYLVNGSKTAYNDTSSSGVYIGTSGIGLGDGSTSFYVSSAGFLYSNSGQIGGCTITSNSITSSDSSWSINSNGNVSFSKGTIGGWTIGTTTLTGGNITLNASGSLSGGSTYSWSIASNGTATFNRLVANSGTLTSLTLSSCTISNASISSGTISSATITKGTISSATISSCTISSCTISSGTISSATITKGTISSATISSCTISSCTISSGTISSATITKGTISSATISSCTISSSCSLPSSLTIGGYSCSMTAHTFLKSVDVSYDTSNTRVVTGVDFENKSVTTTYIRQIATGPSITSTTGVIRALSVSY